MPAIGDTLREARMRKKLDIADVEQRTKIRAKYLRALENEEFGLLPGTTFVKTFLRTYAEELGLDPHTLLEEYRASHEARDETEIAPIGVPAAERRGRERERRYTGGPPPRAAVFGALVVVLIAFLLVLGLVSGGDEGQKRSASAPASTQHRASKPKKKERPKPRPAPTAVSLKIEPQFPTYACVDTGPGTQIVFQGILQQSRSFKGKRLRVNLGKSSAKMVVNGKALQVASTPNPVGYDFTPKNSKPLPPGQRPCA
jgi:cytoskeletal protein RodZ